MWFAFVNGEQVGPVGEEVIARRILRGAYDSETMLWRQGWPEWKRVCDSEFARMLPAPPILETAALAALPITEDRKISLLLGIGIFFIPYIFSWFTLEVGYSRLARVISFAWMLAIIALMISDVDSGNNPRVAVYEDNYENCHIGIFSELVKVKDSVAFMERRLSIISSADSEAHTILQDAWNIASACPKATELKTTIVVTDLIDQYGNAAKDVKAVFIADLVEARKYKKDYMFTQNETVKMVMTVQVKASPIARFLEE